MRPRSFAGWLAIALLGAAVPLSFADSEPGRIAVCGPVPGTADPTVAAVIATMADTIEVDLICLQKFQVSRMSGVNYKEDIARLRKLCRENRIDQAVLADGGARAGGGYWLTLGVFDRQSDSVTLEKQGQSQGGLDMFETMDSLVSSILDELSGTHLVFGSLTVETDPPGAAVSIGNKELGPSPVFLRSLPAGRLDITARYPNWEQADAAIEIKDSETTNAKLSLARSMGAIVLDVPDDAVVLLQAFGMGERVYHGSGVQLLPTGTYQLEAACAGLESVQDQVTIERNNSRSSRPWPKGYLDIATEPSQATVLIDGIDAGTTPAVVPVAPETVHKVELRREGYQPYQSEVRVLQARKARVQTQLTRTVQEDTSSWVPSGKKNELAFDDGSLEQFTSVWGVDDSEVAVCFNLDRKPCRILEARFYVPRIANWSAEFEVRVYSMGVDGAPGTPVGKGKVTSKSDSGNQWVRVDLSRLGITTRLPFFVSMKWLTPPGPNGRNAQFLGMDTNHPSGMTWYRGNSTWQPITHLGNVGDRNGMIRVTVETMSPP